MVTPAEGGGPTAEVAAPCTRQLRQGYRGLRFEPALEQRFRKVYIDQNLDRMRAALWLGVVIIVLVGSIDFLTLNPEIRARALLAEWLVMVPVPLLSLWAAYHPVLYRHLSLFMVASILTAALGLNAVHAAIGHAGFLVSYDSMLLGVFFTYLLSGLLWPANVACGVAISAMTLVSDAASGLGSGLLAYHAFHLLAANAIGASGGYLLERVVRLNFLHAGAADELAGLDQLTNLSNRRAFHRRLERRWNAAVGSDRSLAVLVVDVDYFKRYDVAAGHVAGDKALQQIAVVVQANQRSERDCSARLAGDRFALLLLDAGRSEAAAVANKLLEEVRKLNLHHDDSPIASIITVSVGGAVLHARAGTSADVLLAQAKEALTMAKRSDRNCMHILGAAEGGSKPHLQAVS